MPDGQQGMMPKHAGTGIAHDIADLFPHFRLITVDRAVAAGCLVFLEGAVFEPEPGIFQKFTAVAAEFIPCMVVVPAVDTDHALNGFAFPLHPGMNVCFSLLHARRTKITGRVL